MNLVQFTAVARPDMRTAPGVRTTSLVVHAGIDVFLDLQGRDRATYTTTPPVVLTVTLDLVQAGRDVDLLLRPAVREPGGATGDEVNVFVISETSIWNNGELHDNHFRPDDPAVSPLRDPAVYPTGAATPIAAHYFAHHRAPCCSRTTSSCSRRVSARHSPEPRRAAPAHPRVRDRR